MSKDNPSETECRPGRALDATDFFEVPGQVDVGGLSSLFQVSMTRVSGSLAVSSWWAADQRLPPGRPLASSLPAMTSPVQCSVLKVVRYRSVPRLQQAGTEGGSRCRAAGMRQNVLTDLGKSRFEFSLVVGLEIQPTPLF